MKDSGKVKQLIKDSTSRRNVLKTAGGVGFLSIAGFSRTANGPSNDQGTLAIPDVFVYPEQFGAVGDGTTDDSTAIQDAVNAATLSDKRVLAFMSGQKYRMTETVNIDPAAIQGIEGNGAYILWDPTATDDGSCFSISGSMDTTAAPDATSTDGVANTAKARKEFNFHARGLKMVTPDGSYGDIAMRFNNLHSVRVTDCFITGFQHGLYHRGIIRNTIISENHIWDLTGCGIFFKADVHQGLIKNNHLSYFNKGINLNAGTQANVHIIGNDIEDSAGGGAGAGTHLVHITRSGIGEHVIQGNTFQDHNGSLTTAVVELNNAGSQALVAGNTFSNAATPGLFISEPTNVMVESNQFYNITADNIQVTATGNGHYMTMRNNDFVEQGDRTAGWACNVSGGDWDGFNYDNNHHSEMENGVTCSVNTMLAFSVSQNTFRSHYGEAINLESTSGLFIDGTVSNNAHHSDGNAAGVCICRVAKTATDGRLANVTVCGNVFRGRPGLNTGLFVNGSGSENGIIVANNVVRHKGSGEAFSLVDNKRENIVTKDNINSA